MERLQGIVDRITFQNTETGYTVARLQAEGQRGDPVTVVGELLSLNPGESVVLEGEWMTHKQYGRQFKISSYQMVYPSSVEGMRRYLGSGLIKGVGPVTAKRIVNHFAEETLQVIEQEPDRLTEVEGLGAKRAQIIVKAWEAQREIHNVMLFLQTHGVGTGFAVKIWKRYGQEAVSMIQENPYRLATEVWGIGFQTADEIAQKMGVETFSEKRICAGIQHVLNEAADKNGDVYLSQEALIEMCVGALEVPGEKVGSCLDGLVQDETVILEEDRV